MSEPGKSPRNYELRNYGDTPAFTYFWRHAIESA
jgi:hypothetical protein